MPWQSPFHLPLALAASATLVACVSISPEVKEAFAPPRPEENSHFRLRDPGFPPLPPPGPKATPTSSASAPPPGQPANPSATVAAPPAPLVQTPPPGATP